MLEYLLFGVKCNAKKRKFFEITPKGPILKVGRKNIKKRNFEDNAKLKILKVKQKGHLLEIMQKSIEKSTKKGHFLKVM
jgi:hypothetical protein